MRQVFGIVRYNFFGFLRNPKVIFIFLLEFVLSFLLTGRIMVVMETYDTPVQAIEPFIWTFGDGIAVLSSSLLLLLMFSEDDTYYSIPADPDNQEEMAFRSIHLCYSCNCFIYGFDAAVYGRAVYEKELSR